MLIHCFLLFTITSTLQIFREQILVPSFFNKRRGYRCEPRTVRVIMYSQGLKPRSVYEKYFLSRQDSNPELWGFAPKLGVWSARPPFRLDTDKSFEPFGFKHRALGLRPKAGCIVQVRSSRLIQTSRGFRTLRVRTPSCGASPHSSEFDAQDRPSSLILTEELRTLRVQTQIPSFGAKVFI